MKKITEIFAILLFAVTASAILTLSSAAYTSFYGEEITGCDEIERTDWYNIKDFDADICTDGTVDVSVVVQNCVNAHDNVFLPKGKYLIDGTVYLHDGSGIKGEEGTEIVTHGGGGRVFDARGVYTKDGDTETLDRMEDISISDLDLTADFSGGYFLLGAYGVEDLVLRNINVVGCGLMSLSTVGGDMADLPRDDAGEYFKLLNARVTVSDCTMDGIEALDYITSGGQVGMHLFYVSNVIVEGCEVANYAHGIVYSGGTAHIDNEDGYEYRWIRMGKFSEAIITDCYVHDIAGGGVWGVGARNYILSNSKFVNCYDESADFETGADSMMEGNTFINGPVCAHSACTGKIVYRNNYFEYTEDWTRRMFFQRNSTDTPYARYRQDITMEGNTFVAYGEPGVVNPVNFWHGALASFTFRNNTLTNTVIRSVAAYPDISTENQTATIDLWKLTIEDNDFTFNTPIGKQPAAIYALAGVNTEGVEKADITIRGNTITNNSGVRIDGISVTNLETEDNFDATIENNILNFANLRVSNYNLEISPGVIIKNNKAEYIIVDGYAALDAAGNTHTDGSEYSERDMSVAQYLTAKSFGAKSGEVYAAMLPCGNILGISDMAAIPWNGAEEIKLSKKITEGGTVNTTASFKTLWRETDGGIELDFYVRVEKNENISRQDGFVTAFALDGAKSGNVNDGKVNGGTVEFITAGTVKKTTGKLFEDGKSLITIESVFDDDRKGATAKVTLVLSNETAGVAKLIADAKSGKNPSVLFNIATYEHSSKTRSRGFAAGADVTDVTKLGRLYLADSIGKRLPSNPIPASVPGDINGDGKIKGNDATLLLKYLADWDVTITEANADCNGDGKIKGNDATLLLKYLADWDVKLG